MRPRGVTLALVVLTLPTGCERRTAPPAPEPQVVTSARSGPAGLVVTLDQETLRTVDRLQVRIEADAVDGASIGPPAFDAAAAGWTVVSRTDQPLMFTDAGPVRRSVVMLEPFLAGTYELPPVTLEWTLPSGEQGVVSTESMGVEVRSVLAADDVGDLAGPTGMIRPAPPERDERRAETLAVSAAILAVVVGVGGWWALARRRVREAPRPVDQLRAMAKSNDTDAERIGGAVADSLRRSHPKSEAAREVLDEIDRARYGRMPLSDARAGALLAEAIRILERESGSGEAA